MKRKFSLWTRHGALNSKPVFEAFEKSLIEAGHEVEHNSEEGIPVIWSVLWRGRMQGNEHIWYHAKNNAKKVIVLEVGGLFRNKTWKVGIDGINNEAIFGQLGNNSDRADKLGLKLHPWRDNKEGPIVICGQNPHSLQWKNMPKVSDWMLGVIEEIRKHTDRKILIRPHPRAPLDAIEFEFKNVSRQDPRHIPNTYDDFDFSCDDAWAVINWSSNPATHAVMNGVPVFTGPSSLAWPVANQSYPLHSCNFDQIENPKKPDRQQWLNDIAHTEYTIEEITQGIPLKRLTEFL